MRRIERALAALVLVSLVLTVALATIGPASPASAAPSGWRSPNLLVNPDAESGVGSPTGSDTPVPGWEHDGVTQVAYQPADSRAGGFPRRDGLSSQREAAPNSGLNFFAGGADRAWAIATQTMSLSAYVGAIDAGLGSYQLSGWLGGYGTQDDFVAVQVSFSGPSIATASHILDHVYSEHRDEHTGFVLRVNEGEIPVGARTATVTMQFVRMGGVYNDGYADNMSLVVKTPPRSWTTSLLPEPGTFNDCAEAGSDIQHWSTASGSEWYTDPAYASPAQMVRYASTETTDGFPTVKSPGAGGLDSCFFAGGNHAYSYARADVPLHQYAAAIDTGTAMFALTGTLGGWQSQSDLAVVRVTFAGPGVHAAYALDHVWPAHRNYQTGFVYREHVGLIPAGARYATVEMEFFRMGDGVYNDGYADSIRLLLGT